MKMLSWYKSWFCTSGTLDRKAYVKHIVAAHVFGFGFLLLGVGLFALLLRAVIALQPPVWAAFLPHLVGLPLILIAVGSYLGIFVASTMRYVRHLMQH